MSNPAVAQVPHDRKRADPDLGRRRQPRSVTAIGTNEPPAAAAGGEPGPGQPAGQSARPEAQAPRSAAGEGASASPGAPPRWATARERRPPGVGAAAAPPPPQPQGQPEVLEEVEGVLDFEGKGQGWLRNAKRSYIPQNFDVEVPAGSSTGCICSPATSSGARPRSGA